MLIEGDADTMRREGHAMVADDLERLFALSKSQGQLRFQRLRLRTELDLDLWRSLARFADFGGVILLGHGGEDGIIAAPGCHLTWAQVGEALAPVGVRALLTISCFGGQTGATDALFSAIPTLQVITGSPGTLTAEQAQLAVIDLVCSTCGVVAPEVGNLVLLFNALLTEGVLFRRTRMGRLTSTRAEREVEDVVGQLLALLVKDLL